MTSARHAGDAAGSGPSRSVVKIVVMVLVAAVSAGLFGYIGFLWNTARGLNSGGHRLVIRELNPSTLSTADTANPQPETFSGQNLLVVGNDDRASMTAAQVRDLRVGRDGGSLNTDTMLIIHVPAGGSRATLISMPRDSYVSIPGFGKGKLNSAYGYGYRAANGDVDAKRAAGADLLIKVVKQLTGVSITHFVQISLLGFVTISDAVGGVPIDLCHDVDDTAAYNRDNGHPGVGSGFKLTAGHHTIRGVQALEFVRQRYNIPDAPIGDIARTARQRYFLTAAFRTVGAGLLLDINKLRGVIAAIKNSIYTDQDLNFLDLAEQLSALSANDIHGGVIPTDHYWHDSPVADVGVVHPRAVHAYIARLSNRPAMTTATRPPATRTSPTESGTGTGTGVTASTAPNAVDAGCIN